MQTRSQTRRLSDPTSSTAQDISGTMSAFSRDVTPTPSPRIQPTPLPEIERQALQDQIDALRSRVHHNASPSSAVHHHDLKNVGNRPEEFSGEQSKVYSFLTQVRMYTALQPRQIASDTTKVLFAASYLRGTAFNWFKPYFNLDSIDRPTWLDNFNEFSVNLQDTFGDPERSRTAAKKIHDLKQTKSGGEYWADFQRYAVQTDSHDAAKCFAFRSGLKDTSRKRSPWLKSRRTAIYCRSDSTAVSTDESRNLVGVRIRNGRISVLRLRHHLPVPFKARHVLLLRNREQPTKYEWQTLVARPHLSVQGVVYPQKNTSGEGTTISVCIVAKLATSSVLAPQHPSKMLAVNRSYVWPTRTEILQRTIAVLR